MEKLYLGAAFYPEVYGKDLPTLDKDIKWMKRGGFNVMRIAEFSWSSMEPHDGVFDFDWLHNIVDRLYENGIKVMMCTPSVTAPEWLTKKYPEALKIDYSGFRTQHGGRCHACINSPIYREYTRRIVEKMAKEFANDPAILGWQLDNEIAPYRRGCSCPECMRKFHDRLREKYGTVEELNRRWNLAMWSQAYESLEDVPHPAERTWSNPSLIAEYLEFSSDSNSDFLHMQAEVLRKNGVTAPIGTDMMPIHTQNYPKTVEPLDVVQFNHYNHRENLWLPGYWFSYAQNLKPDVPFWVTETALSNNGSVTAPLTTYPLGFCRVNTLLPFAFGAEMNNYWLWRSHPAGHELMHGSVLSTQGRPAYNFNEVEDISRILTKAEDFLTGTKVKNNGFAMTSSCQADVMLQAQPTVEGLRYDAATSEAWRDLVGSGMLPNVIELNTELDKYKVVYSPYLITMDEYDFSDRLAAWIKDGGVWIAGPLTDIRNRDGKKYMDSLFGLIEKLTGVYCDYSIAAATVPMRVEWRTGTSETKVWVDAYTAAAGQEVLAKYTNNGEPSPFEGMAACVWCPVGKGGVIVVGTQPDKAALRDIVSFAFDKAGIKSGVKSDDNIIVVERKGSCDGIIACEVEYKCGKVELDCIYDDEVSAERFEGVLELKPYEVRILRRVK